MVEGMTDTVLDLTEDCEMACGVSPRSWPDSRRL